MYSQNKLDQKKKLEKSVGLNTVLLHSPHKTTTGSHSSLQFKRVAAASPFRRRCTPTKLLVSALAWVSEASKEVCTVPVCSACGDGQGY